MATKKKTEKTTETKTDGVIQLPEIRVRLMNIRIEGDSPLVIHKWSEKAKQEMRDKQMGKPKHKKEAKDPTACYEASMYRLPDGRPGFKSLGFKAAAVAAARFMDGAKMTVLRGAFHIFTGERDDEGNDLVAIDGTPNMREDLVRVGMGTADLRYRAEFFPWAATLPVRFNEAAISKEQLLALFDIAGFGVGIGEYRPDKKGSWGMFHVAGAEVMK